MATAVMTESSSVGSSISQTNTDHEREDSHTTDAVKQCEASAESSKDVDPSSENRSVPGVENETSSSGSMKKSAGTCFTKCGSTGRGKLGVARKCSMSSSDSCMTDQADTFSHTSQETRGHRRRNMSKDSSDSDDDSRPEVADVRDILNALEEVEMIDRETFENFRRQLRELELLENDLFDLEEAVPQVPEVPSYPIGETRFTECNICLVVVELHLRPCCSQPVCQDCIVQYLSTQVQQANIRIQCPSFNCDTSVHRDEILASLHGEVKDKFYRFLVEANKDPHIKTCPRCSHIHSVEKSLVSHPSRRKQGLKVDCPSCQLEWCFLCQAPWHQAMKCREFQRGDKLLKAWAKEQHYGQANAQRCPRCDVSITNIHPVLTLTAPGSTLVVRI